MYRRMYGNPRTYSRQLTMFPREPTGHRVQAEQKIFASSLQTTAASPSNAPVLYRCGARRWPGVADRDAEVWGKLLEGESLDRLRALQAERRNAEPAYLDPPALIEVKKECLLVEGLDLHVPENSERHHTDLFHCATRDKDPQLVVRRGEEFQMTLTFQRPWSSKDDDMYLVFTIGEEPNPNKGSYAKIKLEEGKDTSYMSQEKKEWGARIVAQTGNSLTVAVYPPPDVIIGEWDYGIRTVKVKDGEDKIYECKDTEEIIILLNPWCKDDQVYIDEKTDDVDGRDEYILNQIGLVFCGSYHNIQSKPWFYDQFEQGILEACLHILRKANDFCVSSKMADPVYISRALSRILNNCDDNGVLSGRWDGDYGDGTRPTTWMSSASIIEKYMVHGQPVKYGQCWVFSHLLTTVSRALGLPCRSVTNFSSAHDTDLTMTIDKYVDEDGEDLEYKNDDSVWNFHVWNEVWIRRPDLDRLTGHKGRYDGWHAVDATPQELSDSVFQCGPSPLVAIREGEVHIGYDTKFIFAEVNAEYCTWQDGYPPVIISRNSHRVGRKISTKWPNGKAVAFYNGVDKGTRLDVTDLYKHAEGSGAERKIVEKATNTGRLGFFLFENKSGVGISIHDLEQRPRVGKDVTLKVKVENSTSEVRSVSVRTSVRPTNYWGGILGKEKVAFRAYEEEQLEAGQSKEFELTVLADDILRLCDDALSMKVLALCKVGGFPEPVCESDNLVIKCPGVKCTGPERKVDVGETFDVEMILKNPLPSKPLTGCRLHIQGSVEVQEEGFAKEEASYRKDIGDLQPSEIRTIKVKVKPSCHPRKSRDRELNVGLITKELPDFVGNLDIELN